MAASGVIGSDHARWIPLLETYDRFGRPRGPAAALMLNYRGHYRGSSWAYFGVENIDLFANAQRPASALLKQLLRFFEYETFLHNFQIEKALYRRGESIRLSTVVSNHGRHGQSVEVVFRLVTRHRGIGRDQPASEAIEPIVTRHVVRRVEAGKTVCLEVEFPPPALFIRRR